MAENIYSKGTRVWFEDKDQAWISAEVLSTFKGTDDAIRLVFIDERGKVVWYHLNCCYYHSLLPFHSGNHYKYHWKGYQRW